MKAYAVILLVAVVFLEGCQSNSIPNRCPSTTSPNQGVNWYGNPYNCRKYFVCVHGNPVEKECPRLNAFSEELGVCVHVGYPQDKCTGQRPVQECELGNADLIPHPTQCHRYFNCSGTKSRSMYSVLMPYEQMCPYPQGFDIYRKTCVHYTQIVCGEHRDLPTWECDYRQYINLRAPPCSIYNPSCVGRPDGEWPHDQKLWSPYYVTCQGERSVNGEEYCTRHSMTRMTRLFHPTERRCLTLWKIPRSKYGLEPSCDGKDPGHYYVRETPLIAYKCPGKELFLCPRPIFIDPDISKCTPFDG